MHVLPDQAALEAICQRYRIRRLSLFGSTLKATPRSDSDVDLLVEFEPGATPSVFRWLRSNWNCRHCSAVARSICAPPAT